MAFYKKRLSDGASTNVERYMHKHQIYKRQSYKHRTMYMCTNVGLIQTSEITNIRPCSITNVRLRKTFYLKGKIEILRNPHFFLLKFCCLTESEDEREGNKLLYINLACLSVCLFVCLFVSNKRQNG